MLSLVAIELIKEPVAVANSVWFTKVVSNEDVKLSKELNLLFAEDVNWLRDEVTFDKVPNLVSTDDVKLFSGFNIEIICDEPLTTPFVAFIAPFIVVAVTDPAFIILFPPKLKFPVIDLFPFARTYWVWSSCSNPKRFPCTDDAFTPAALKPITGLISCICVMFAEPDWTYIDATGTTPSLK